MIWVAFSKKESSFGCKEVVRIIVYLKIAKNIIQNKDLGADNRPSY